MREPIAFWNYPVTTIRLDDFSPPQVLLPSEAGEVSASCADGGVESPSPVAQDPSVADKTATPPRLRQGGEHERDLPYTAELLGRISLAFEDMQSCWLTSPLGRAAFLAERLLAHGIALVDPSRARCWIDEAVYSGALFRLRLAEQPPSITLPQGLFI